MRAKYIEEQYGDLMIFGEHADGCVDLMSTDLHNADIVTHIPRDQAIRLMTFVTRLQQKLIETALVFDAAAPDAFTKYWYG